MVVFWWFCCLVLVLLLLCCSFCGLLLLWGVCWGVGWCIWVCLGCFCLLCCLLFVLWIVVLVFGWILVLLVFDCCCMWGLLCRVFVWWFGCGVCLFWCLGVVFVYWKSGCCFLLVFEWLFWGLLCLNFWVWWFFLCLFFGVWFGVVGVGVFWGLVWGVGFVMFLNCLVWLCLYCSFMYVLVCVLWLMCWFLKRMWFLWICLNVMLCCVILFWGWKLRKKILLCVLRLCCKVVNVLKLICIGWFWKFCGGWSIWLSVFVRFLVMLLCLKLLLLIVVVLMFWCGLVILIVSVLKILLWWKKFRCLFCILKCVELFSLICGWCLVYVWLIFLLYFEGYDCFYVFWSFVIVVGWLFVCLFVFVEWFFGVDWGWRMYEFWFVCWVGNVWMWLVRSVGCVSFIDVLKF